MAAVAMDNISSLYEADSRPKMAGFVSRNAAAWRYSTFINAMHYVNPHFT